MLKMKQDDKYKNMQSIENRKIFIYLNSWVKIPFEFNNNLFKNFNHDLSRIQIVFIITFNLNFKVEIVS